MKQVTLTKSNIFNTKRFVLDIPNNSQRFSRKSEALKFAEDNDFQVIDKVLVEPKKIKVGRWQ